MSFEYELGFCTLNNNSPILQEMPTAQSDQWKNAFNELNTEFRNNLWWRLSSDNCLEVSLGLSLSLSKWRSGKLAMALRKDKFNSRVGGGTVPEGGGGAGWAGQPRGQQLFQGLEPENNGRRDQSSSDQAYRFNFFYCSNYFLLFELFFHFYEQRGSLLIDERWVELCIWHVQIR